MVVAPLIVYFASLRTMKNMRKRWAERFDRKAPFYFQKSFDALTFEPDVRYPTYTEDLHHEVELVAVVGKGGRNLSLGDAETVIFGYAVGLDFTRRDRQMEAKEKGRPWEIAKNFDDSGVMGVVTPKSESGLMDKAVISLDVNGEDDNPAISTKWSYNVAELIAFLSTIQELKSGDLIYRNPVGRGCCGSAVIASSGKIDGLVDLDICLV